VGKLEKLTDKAREHLEPDENVDGAVLGAYEVKIMGQDSVRNGVLLATDHRLFFYAKKVTGYDIESFPYENISSFEQGKNMMGGTISFFASGNKATMKWIKEGDLRLFTEIVRGRMGKSKPAVDRSESDSAPSATDDIPAQITKLAALRDAGVLTEAEFADKKAELLSRM
jgi:hypothetical protein